MIMIMYVCMLCMLSMPAYACVHPCMPVCMYAKRCMQASMQNRYTILQASDRILNQNTPVATYCTIILSTRAVNSLKCFFLKS